MRLIPLFLLLTTIAGADTRSDLESALRSLGGHDPIRARVDLELFNWASDAKSPPIDGGRASAQVEATQAGLSIHWDRRQLDEATRPDPESAATADSTRRAMAALSVPQVLTYLNIARDIAAAIDGAELTHEERAELNGQTVRLLTFKLDPKLDEKNRKYIKEIEATARIWVGADGVPLAAERGHRLKGRAMLVISFEAEESERFEFARTGDRLVVTRHTKEGRGSGAGESNKHKSSATLTIEPPPA